jgi:hypothetical protein
MTTDADVEMEDAGVAEEPKADTEPKPNTPVLEHVLASNLKLISKAVATREARLLFGRLLRQTATVRSQLSGDRLAKFVEDTLDPSSPVKSFILQLSSEGDEVRFKCCPPSQLVTVQCAHGAHLPASPIEYVILAVRISVLLLFIFVCGIQAMDSGVPSFVAPAVEASSSQPEEEAYCVFLLCQFLVDQKKFDRVCQPSATCDDLPLAELQAVRSLASILVNPSPCSVQRLAAAVP